MRFRNTWRSLRRSIFPFRWEQCYVAALHFRKYQNLRLNPGIHSLQPFDQHKCIFIHVPKNGGISVADGLFGKDRMLGGHYSIDFYKIVFGKEFENYFKFGFSRNPWDRLVSAFYYLKGGGLDFRDVAWERNHISQYKEFGEFVDNWLCSKNIRKGMHFIPQSDFLCDCAGSIAVNFVGRFETMDRDFAFLADRLNLGKIRLPYSNQSKRRKDYRTYYKDHQAERVASVYAKDINLFKYHFDSPFS